LLVGKQLALAYVNEVTANAPVETVPDDAGTPTARRNLIFAIVSIGLFMVSVDQTIVATALTAIQKELHTQINWSSWTITIYSLGQVVAMPMAGKLSDMFGRKRVFLIAVAVFTVASLCCGFAGNIYLLLISRAIQALGGGAFMPSATGIVADHFGTGRDRAVGMFTSIFPIGGIVGPIIGGIFVSYWSWRGIFLVNVPIGIALIGLVIKFIPANSERVSRRIDVRGIIILTVLILSAMFGITYLGTGQATLYSPVFLGCEAVALVAGWVFIRHSKRDPAPFVPFALLRGRGFGVMNMINLIYGAAVIGFAALVPLYAQERYHIAPLGAGTLLTARAVGMISVASLAVFTMRRTGYRLPMIGGFTILAAGLGLMALPAPISPYVWLAIGAAITGCGMGMSVPSTNNASLQLAPDQVAAIAGLRGMFRQAGSIIAVSVVTAIIARSHDPGPVQAHVFVVFALLMLALLPVVWFGVPEHRGSW
jgi:EmrB/QacA subfamily drug resistance transporter